MTRFECARDIMRACSLGPQNREACGLVLEKSTTMSGTPAAVKLSRPVDKDGELCSS